MADVMAPPCRRLPKMGDTTISLSLSVLVILALAVFFVVPVIAILWRSFDTGAGFGLGNYVAALSDPRIWELVINSLAVSGLSAICAVTLAYFYAYALQRTNVVWKSALRMVVMLPLFAPSLIQAQGLIFLLGRNGIFNRFLGFDIEIYGFWGVAIANTLYTFPYAFLILSAALAVADARLYEGAIVMGARPFKIFRTVTLASTKFDGTSSFCHARRASAPPGAHASTWER